MAYNFVTEELTVFTFGE